MSHALSSPALRLPLAVALALAAHVAAFAMVPQLRGSTDGSGEAGEALVSLQAAPGDLQDLVALWDSPPDVAAQDTPLMPQPDALAALQSDGMPLGLSDAAPDFAQPAALQAPLPPDGPPLAVAPPEEPPRIAATTPEPLSAPLPPDSPDPTPLPAPTPDLPASLTAALLAPLPLAADAPPTLAKPNEATPPDATPSATAPQNSPRPKLRPKADKPSERAAKARPAQQPAAKPKPTAPAKPSAPSAGQKAAGAGKGSVAGTGGAAKTATLSKARINDLQAGWGASIRARIEARKRYPAQAGGASGKVTLRLMVTRAGELAGVSVAKSSGSAVLDAAALKAVKSAGRFTKAPKGLDQARYSFTLPMSFSR